MAETATTSSRATKREARRANPDRLSAGRLVAWSGAGISAGANFIVLGYLTMYATDVLGMSPVTIGSIIAVGTLVNAVFGLIAAWIVDRSPETRWGKARPYELAVPLLWIGTGFLFAVPSAFGGAAQVAWVVIVFLFIKAIAAPLLGANDTLYMARAFPNRMVYAKVQTRAGILTALGSIAISVTLPVLLNGAGKSAEAWSGVIAGYAVVLGIVGLSRALFVDEKYKVEAGEKPVKVRDMIQALKGNPYIWLLFGMLLASQAMIGANVGSYYFRYVVGNLAVQGLLAPFGILLLPLLLIIPRLMRRYAVSQIIIVGALMGLVGGILNLLAGANVPILIVAGLFTGLGALPVSYLGVVMVLDLATYNESRGRRRLESTLGALVGIAGNIGAALGAAVVGWVMAGTGYDGSLETQTGGATWAIRLLFGGAFVLGYILVIIFMFFFTRFEKNVLPAAQARVAGLRTARGLTATGAIDPNADGADEE